MICKTCPHTEFKEGLCFRCWKESSDPAFAATWKGRAPAPVRGKEKTKAKTTNAQCIHLGQPTGALHTCPPCQGNVQVKEFACAIHGKCTIAKKAGAIACCGNCPDRTFK